MSDNSSEFRNTILQRFVETMGIKHEFSSPHQPSENDIAERVNGTVYSTVWLMHVGLPQPSLEKNW